MGDPDLTKDQQAGEIGDVPDLPGTRDIPLEIDPTLVKNLYNGFCDRCEEAGLPRPPRWG